MNGLEGLFRRRFEPDGDGYRFHLPDRTVRFSAAEVEQFVADWRRVSLSPLLWGAFALFGLAGPVALATMTFNGTELVMLAAIVTWIWHGLGLMMAWQAPGAVAVRREVVGPGRPSYRIGLAWLAIGLLNFALGSRHGLFDSWIYLGWGMMVLLGVVDLARNYRRSQALGST